MRVSIDDPISECRRLFQESECSARVLLYTLPPRPTGSYLFHLNWWLSKVSLNLLCFVSTQLGFQKKSLPSATNYPDHQPWLCRRYCDQILMHFHHQLRAFIRPSSRLGIRAATISLRPPPMLILQLLMAAPRLSTSSDRLARPCVSSTEHQ